MPEIALVPPNRGLEPGKLPCPVRHAAVVMLVAGVTMAAHLFVGPRLVRVAHVRGPHLMVSDDEVVVELLPLAHAD